MLWKPKRTKFIKIKIRKFHYSELFCVQITNFVFLEKDNAIKYKNIFFKNQYIHGPSQNLKVVVMDLLNLKSMVDHCTRQMILSEDGLSAYIRYLLPSKCIVLYVYYIAIIIIYSIKVVILWLELFFADFFYHITTYQLIVHGVVR